MISVGMAWCHSAATEIALARLKQPSFICSVSVHEETLSTSSWTRLFIAASVLLLLKSIGLMHLVSCKFHIRTSSHTYSRAIESTLRIVLPLPCEEQSYKLYYHVSQQLLAVILHESDHTQHLLEPKRLNCSISRHKTSVYTLHWPRTALGGLAGGPDLDLPTQPFAKQPLPLASRS